MFLKKNNKQKQQKKPKQNNNGEFPIQIFTDVKKNIENIKKMLGSPGDLVVREFTIGDTDHSCAVICIDGLIDKDLVEKKVIKSIQDWERESSSETTITKENIIQILTDHILPTTGAETVKTLDDVMLPVLSGDTALFINGLDDVLIIGSKGFVSRGIEEPLSEGLVRGPREGFNENIRTNTMLIRRSIRDPNLRFKTFKTGRRSKKDVIITYVEGIVNPSMVKEVKRRLESIDLDDVPESGFIEQWIQDSFLSPFPQIQYTERPDRVRSAITQGRVAILLDGTPFVLIVPVTFGQLFHSPEDYYERWGIATFVRLLRFGAGFFTVFLPGFYIAIVSFHPGMIPTKLAMSIAGTREGVPFPAVIEAFIMEMTMELLREAGLRLPKPIGQTVGIVGGLVIGQAAVEAGIISPIMVIVVAITAISSFALPSYSLGISLRLLRFGVMLAAAFMGLYGIILVYIMINIHLANLKSFGIPYSTPFGPTILSDLKDMVIRVPLLMQKKRPAMMQTKDTDRIGTKNSQDDKD